MVPAVEVSVEELVNVKGTVPEVLPSIDDEPEESLATQSLNPNVKQRLHGEYEL